MVPFVGIRFVVDTFCSDMFGTATLYSLIFSADIKLKARCILRGVYFSLCSRGGDGGENMAK